MPEFILTKNYIYAIQYGSIITAIILFLYLLFLLLADFILNQNYKKLNLKILIGIAFMMLFRLSGENYGTISSFFDKCDLYEKDCAYCGGLIIAPAIFFIYFLIGCFFSTILYQSSNDVKPLGINFNKFYILFCYSLTLSNIYCLVMVIYERIIAEYVTLYIVYRGYEVCYFNNDILVIYNDLIAINTPIYLSSLIIYLFSYLYLYYKLYRFNYNNINIKIMKETIKNILLTITYILLYFVWIILPQYIFHNIPLSFCEYFTSIICLSLYFNEIHIFDKLYKFTYHYPNKWLSSILFSKEVELERIIIRDEISTLTNYTNEVIIENNIIEITDMDDSHDIYN